MAARPGEEITATLFADVHYFYGPPTAKPPHHRFDKASYVYLYENAAQRRARIEIANSAGTPDQDAFDGPLDQVKVTYDYQHPNLITITIDAFPLPPGSPPAPETNDWRLPTYDPRNETKYLYRLQSFDVYLWTAADAQLFINALQRVLPESHLSITGARPPPPAHAQAMSPIVQQLENIAIKEHEHPVAAKQSSAAPTFAGPPTSAAPAQEFAPMAYNPAAPPAPEAIAHREKTPPPEDAGPNPLLAAAAQEHTPQQQQQFHGGGGFQPGALGRVPTGGLAAAPYFPGPPSSSGGQYAPSSAPAPTSHHQHAPAVSQPLQSPSFPAYPGSTPAAPVAPAGGFSTYSYASQPARPAGGGAEYNIHQQVYRPTEGEATGEVKPVGEASSKLGQNAVRLEKGVTGFLKKFEKKYG